MSNTITIRVEHTRFGSMLLCPTTKEDRKSIANSNQYTVLLQNSQDIDSFLESYPSIKEEWEAMQPGDFTFVEVDMWEYRHMVGGQSD